MATLAGELGLDPSARPMERKSLSAPRSPHLGSRYGDRSPRREVREPSGRKKGVESNVEAYASVARVLDSSGRESATCFSPRRYTCGGIARKAERGAGAFRAKAPRPEMAARSVGGEGTRIDCRRIGNGQNWTVGAGKGQAGSSEDTEKRNRREREREGKKRGSSSSSGEMVEYSSTHEGLEREDDSKVRRTAASKPGALLHSGLVMTHRQLGRQVEDCETVDAVQAKRSGGCLSLDCAEGECREQARVQEHSRIAVFSRSRGSADAWTSGECRRRPDPEIPRSGSGGTGGRVRLRQSLEDTEEEEEEQRPGPPPSLEERGRRRRTQSRSPDDPGGTKIEKERPPHETRNGGTKLEEEKARAKENEASSCASRTSPNSVHMGKGPGAPMEIQAAGETRSEPKLEANNAAQVRC